MTTKTNGVIGTQEKKELSKLIDTEFRTIIDNMKQEIQFTEGEILEEAQKKFGIQAMNKEIQHLKDKIAFIEKKKTQMGFSGDSFAKQYPTRGGYNQEVNPNTKAGRFYYLKVARSVDIQALENARSERLKKLWLFNDRAEVTLLVNEKVDVKLLSKPKK